MWQPFDQLKFQLICCHISLEIAKHIFLMPYDNMHLDRTVIAIHVVPFKMARHHQRWWKAYRWFFFYSFFILLRVKLTLWFWHKWFGWSPRDTTEIFNMFKWIYVWCACDGIKKLIFDLFLAWPSIDSIVYNSFELNLDEPCAGSQNDLKHIEHVCVLYNWTRKKKYQSVLISNWRDLAEK